MSCFPTFSSKIPLCYRFPCPFPSDFLDSTFLICDRGSRGNQARLCIFLHRGPCDGVTCPVHQVSIQSKLLSVRFPLGFSRWPPSHGMKVVVHSLWKKRQKRGVPTFRGELGFRGSEQKVPLMELPCPPILASLPLQTRVVSRPENGFFRKINFSF